MGTLARSSKEIIRHTLYKTGGRQFIRAFKKLKGVPHAHLIGETNAERFSSIYDNRVWAFIDDKGSLSGPGSNRWATEELVESLGGILGTLKIERLIDIGCGDFGWMQHVKGEFSYVGIDVVRSVVMYLNENYGSPNRKFVQADATIDDIPPGDAALCREVLFHLSFDDIWGVIANLKRRKYTFLIATSDKNTWFNSNITSGDHRPLNLEKAPFRFPEPIHVIKDDKVAEDRIIGVWPLATIDPPRRMMCA